MQFVAAGFMPAQPEGCGYRIGSNGTENGIRLETSHLTQPFTLTMLN